MKIVIPDNMERKELFKFLIENKSALINQKKALIKHTDSIACKAGVTPVTKTATTKASIPSTTDQPENEDGVIHVKVVANACLWMDSQSDVLLRDSAKKTIAERKGLMVHLHDHIYQVDAQVGDVTNVYLQDVSLSDLGLNKIGTTQCIIFETDIKEEYNQVVYNLYAANKIFNHSIGLQYIKIGLAIDDDTEMAEYDLWNKYIDQVINKDEAVAQGYFWVVQEIKLLENSSVLFGANSLTPTLEVGQPSQDTGKSQPLTSTDKSDDSITKSKVICPNCKEIFSSNGASTNCPGCGQYVSPNSTQAQTFDLIAAIQQTTFIN